MPLATGGRSSKGLDVRNLRERRFLSPAQVATYADRRKPTHVGFIEGRQRRSCEGQIMRTYADHAGVRGSCGRGNGRACPADSAPLLAYALGLALRAAIATMRAWRSAASRLICCCGRYSARTWLVLLAGK